MSRGLSVAIAGAGFIGAVHARAARLAGATLTGIAASSPASAEQAARRLGAERAYASAEELAQAPEVDVLHVCTPNHLHRELAEAALQAGKHVICEKPLALDASGAESLVAAAEQAGRVAAVPFVYRYYPTVREARELVRTGATGRLRLIHGTYLQDWLSTPDDDNWRVDAELGGASRAFADIGAHWCDLAEFVSGQRIARLCARTLTALPQRRHDATRAAFAAGSGNGDSRGVGTEDAVTLQFETDGGVLGALVVSQVSPGRKNRIWLELDGSRESLCFDQEHPETLWRGAREAATVVTRDPLHLSPPAARLATLPAGHPQGYADCFDAFVADVYATIADGHAPDGMPVFADGLRAARLTEAVLESAREQRWIDLPTAAPAAGVLT